ncbi:MAG: hypothetical protein IRY91_02100 [Gemmatimonadaceae bacterium]|nr:hypothetical protein [Gemmatimonadaceae bacterium]
MRIVSLVPAGTDIVCALGLARELVGVSHECDLPAEGTRAQRLTRSLVDTGARSSAEIHAAVSERAPVVCLEWLDPPFAAGHPDAVDWPIPTNAVAPYSARADD